MVKCPFCQFDNEEGSLFCEQCKSDLSAVESVPVAQEGEAALGEEIPMAGEMIEAIPEGAPLFSDAVPAGSPPFMEADFGAGQAEEVVAFEQVAEPPVAEAMPVMEESLEPPMAQVPEAEPIPMASPPEQVPVPVPPPPPMAAPAAAAPSAEGDRLPAGAQPRLVVLRGLKINVEYPIYEGLNFIGRADEKPVDIDLEDQEPPDRIWSSRQHAVINYEQSQLLIEDLNSSNGTYVNRVKLYPGQKKAIKENDVVQIGTVQMKLKV